MMLGHPNKQLFELDSRGFLFCWIPAREERKQVACEA